MPGRAAGHLAQDREQVQQAKDDADGGRAVPHRGGYAQAEQRDQGEVEHRADGGAQHRPVGQRQVRVAVRGTDAVAGQDQPPGQHRAEHGEGSGEPGPGR